MAVDTILQHWILTDFVYPFLLAFFIVFAVLEKTKVLTSDNKQLNAMVAFVIGLIFVGAIFPKVVVGNLILFLTVGLVIVFVFLLLWGFVMGESPKFDKPAAKWIAGALIFIAVVIAVFWATGTLNVFTTGYNFLFHSTWSREFWTNAIFVIVVVGAIASVLKSSGSSSGGHSH